MKLEISEVIMVLDRSGSMGPIRDATIEVMNKFLVEQRAVQGVGRFTLAQFDHEYESVYEAVDLERVPYFSDRNYEPRGGTALYDAIADTIDSADRRISQLAVQDRPTKVIFIVVTDGYENSSKRHGERAVREKIERQKKKDWQFVFIGANLDAQAVAKNIAIPISNALQFGHNMVGTSNAIRSASNLVAQYRSGMGGQSLGGFSEEDRLMAMSDESSTDSKPEVKKSP